MPSAPVFRIQIGETGCFNFIFSICDAPCCQLFKDRLGAQKSAFMSDGMIFLTILAEKPSQSLFLKFKNRDWEVFLETVFSVEKKG